MLSSNQKAKLKWQCRRGMLELDLILGRFVAQDFAGFTESQIQCFEQLLTSPDPDLYAWLMGYETPEQPEFINLVAFLRTHNPG